MDGLHLMATAMHAAQVKLEISASNLANVSSDGFRKRVARIALTGKGLVTSAVTDAAQAPLRHTGRAFDVALAGGGSFGVRDAGGRRAELRAASLERNARGELTDERGRVVIGTHGPIVASADATIDTQGVVRDAGVVAGRIALPPGASLQSGFLESTSVDGVREMVDVLAAQRAFETAQKTLAALDDERQKDANDVARVKA
jgi:flagellar basal-body rod protein FlgG